MMFLEHFTGFTHFPRVSVAVSRHGCRALTTLALVALAACATPAIVTDKPVANTPEARKARVEERSQARWDALIKNDLNAAYGFLSPGSRQVLTLDNFKSRPPRVAFREARVETVTCDGDACKTKVLATYDHRLMKGLTATISEAWIVEGGQAWYVNVD